MSVITNPISNIPKLAASHVRGWSEVWSDQLGADINHACDVEIVKAEEVFIEHGVNFGGTLNLFGGANETLFDRLNRVAECKNVISLDIPMPDFGAQLKKRIGAASTFNKITEEWCNRISQGLNKSECLKQEDLLQLFPDKFTGAIFGDSHSPAFSHSSDVVLRKNGRTLFGMLKQGLGSELTGIRNPKKITFSLGSIDIRHHILRHTDSNVEDIVSEYVKQGSEVSNMFNCEVWYCAPVPVEHEGRKLPKTGYYKGTPFFGSRQERLDLTFRFIELLDKKSGGKLVMPPEAWYNMDGEEYAVKYMENASSVHISPQHYRRKTWQ